MNDTYLTHISSSIVAFGSPAGFALRAAIIFPLVGLAFAALVFFLPAPKWRLAFAHSTTLVPRLIAGSLIIVLFTLCGFVAHRKLSANNIEFNLAIGTYRQTTVDLHGWKAGDANDSTVSLSAPVHLKGRTEADLERVGIRALVSESRFGVTRQYLLRAVWRDPNHPSAQLSQVYGNESEAQSVMHQVAALLKVPALGASQD